MHQRSARIGIDVGGTFTDFVVDIAGEPAPRYLKESSTPEDPSLAVLAGLQRVLATLDLRAEDITSIAHGTTIGLNALIQRRGARTALVASDGHRDILELTRRLPQQFNLRQDPSVALIPRNMVIEIDARLNADGEVLAVPDDAEISRVASLIRDREAEAVALTILHSYANLPFEQEVASRLATALSDVPVTASSAIWPEIREYNRTSAVALNAYIAPLMSNYLSGLQMHLEDLGIKCPLFITASNGGSLGVRAASERPVDTILSGPASGVTAAVGLAARAQLSKVVSFDMGGTSSDMAVAIDGDAEFSTHAEVGGLPLILPVVDVSAIGAGGGSIARVDAHGRLQVGPESAGATPGPAAYGLGGTRPTISDAYLVTGILSESRFLGGERILDRAAAERSFLPISKGLAISGEHATERSAESVITLATIGMAAEIQKVMARRGHDPREFTLVPFGGAGPTHSTILAREVGISRVVVPLAAGTYCALGAVDAPLRRDYLRGVGKPLTPRVAHLTSEASSDLCSDGSLWLREQGDSILDQTLDLFVDMRYAGQAFDVPVRIDPEALPLSAEQLEEMFAAEHEAIFGHRDHGAEVTVIAVRLNAIGNVRQIPLPDRSDYEPSVNGTRAIFFGGSWHEATELSLHDLVGSRRSGPAVIDLPHTTVLVLPDWTVELSAGNSLTLRDSLADQTESEETA